MGSCLSTIRVALKGTSVNEKSSVNHVPVELSTIQKGPRVSVSALVITGKGTACTIDAIEFEHCYFEIVVKAPGKFAVGVALASTDPEKDLGKMLGDNKQSWGLKSDMLAAIPDVGDVIGVSVDQSSSPKLSFSLNGLPLGDLYDVPRPRTELKISGGRLFPAASVDKGASVEFHFRDSSLKYPPPLGYQTLIAVRDVVIC